MRHLLLVLIAGCGGRIDGAVDDSASSSAPHHRVASCDNRIYLLGVPDAPDPPQLLALAPETLKLDTIGPIDCGGIPREAFSMAVTSDTAYVEWVDYATQATDVFRIRLKDATCSSSVRMNRPAFEMTFVEDRVFISDVHHLYSADVETFSTMVIAPLPHLGRAPLTATADGRLYAMFPTGELAQLDPASGQVLESMPLRDPGTFALAYLDGEFFLFADRLLERYRDGALQARSKMPMSIVGAGTACH